MEAPIQPTYSPGRRTQQCQMLLHKNCLAHSPVRTLFVGKKGKFRAVVACSTPCVASAVAHERWKLALKGTDG